MATDSRDGPADADRNEAVDLKLHENVPESLMTQADKYFLLAMQECLGGK